MTTEAHGTSAAPEVRFRTHESERAGGRLNRGGPAIDGARVRYADGGGSQEPAVLLTSPWPESLYAFAPIWATLAKHARLFAIDLPGFGASERREDLLSPVTKTEVAAAWIGNQHSARHLPVAVRRASAAVGAS